MEKSSSAISRLIMEALNLTGINVSIFKGHSARAESSSKAIKASFSMADILARSSWCSSSTWKRFYNNHIMMKMIYIKNQKTSFG